MVVNTMTRVMPCRPRRGHADDRKIFRRNALSFNLVTLTNTRYPERRHYTHNIALYRFYIDTHEQMSWRFLVLLTRAGWGIRVRCGATNLYSSTKDRMLTVAISAPNDSTYGQLLIVWVYKVVLRRCSIETRLAHAYANVKPLVSS
jgi:hypothetical protein